MKKQYLFSLPLVVMLFAGCVKDKVSEDNDFIIKNVGFIEHDGSKSYFFSDFNTMFYEEGDKIKINGKQFVLGYNSEGEWTAKSTGSVQASGGTFSCVSGASTASFTSSNQTYKSIALQNTNNYQMNMLIGGQTNTNVLTLWPACAIIVLDETVEYIAFASAVVPASGIVYDPATHRITSAATCLASSNPINGDFSYDDNVHKKKRIYPSVTGDGARYAVVPINGESIQSKIYMMMNIYTGGGFDPSTGTVTPGTLSRVVRATQGAVTLQPGKVYRMSIPTSK